MMIAGQVRGDGTDDTENRPIGVVKPLAMRAPVRPGPSMAGE